MATYQAVPAVCEAVLQLLRSNYRAADFGQIELEFKVYLSSDFASPMQAGVSLFLYRVLLNGVRRNPPGPTSSRRPGLPLELHFLLTAWAREPSLQGAIAGWMMRTLEDTPVLVPGLLNATWPGVFCAGESVEVVLGEMATQDMIHLWDRLAERGFHLSVPYVARGVQIDSALELTAAVPVGTRAPRDGSPGEI